MSPQKVKNKFKKMSVRKEKENKRPNCLSLWTNKGGDSCNKVHPRGTLVSKANFNMTCAQYSKEILLVTGPCSKETFNTKY